MSEKKLIPYAVMNWSELVDGYYVIDHTRFIPELEKCKTPVFLRPKRFGKSVVCSMLEHYYDINRKEDFERLFGWSDIGKNPTKLRNSFLVIRFDFSKVEPASTVDEIERNFITHVQCCILDFATHYEIVGGKRIDWSAAANEDSAAKMVTRLLSIIAQNKLPPLYVIVDEYDNFTNELVVSNREHDYDAICGHDNTGLRRDSFFKTFFKVFKAGLIEGTVGRTYFTGGLPITLDDLSSGFNVGTVVSLNKKLLNLVGFTKAEVIRYVDRIFEDYGFDPSKKDKVLSDIKAFYDGYRMLPGGDHLYNATITNWYLFKLVADEGAIPTDVIDSNVRTDIGWFRKLAGAKARERVRGYIERGEGERVQVNNLTSRFGRSKFFSDEFFPYALYYLGLMTFKNPFRLEIPNLTIKSLFVDYYDELSEVTNVDEARRGFLTAAEDLALNGGSWENLFEQYWIHYVKARIPAQAFDKINENFFRLTFTSRAMDALLGFYSFEQEYNTPEGRVDFLATPRPGNTRPALLIEYKYFKSSELAAIGVEPQPDGTCDASKRTEPDAETLAQAKRYRDSLPKRDGWDAEIVTKVIEVYCHYGYRWFSVPD